MLAVEHYPSSDFFGNYPLNDFPKHELLEVNRSKVSIHNAKAGYSYPTIRLPYSFSMLAGLPTQIYQTVHKLSLIHISEPTRRTPISYAVFCLKKKKTLKTIKKKKK